MSTREERDAAKCHEPLDLGPGARQAFVDRQAKLLAWDHWPVFGWYNDEDFCRAYNTAVQLADEVERLRAIVDKLPKTADGVPVVPGMTLWDSIWLGRPFGVQQLSVFCPNASRSEWMCNEGEVDVSQCYSTRAAAEAAGEK